MGPGPIEGTSFSSDVFRESETADSTPDKIGQRSVLTVDLSSSDVTSIKLISQTSDMTRSGTVDGKTGAITLGEFLATNADYDPLSLVPQGEYVLRALQDSEPVGETALTLEPDLSVEDVSVDPEENVARHFRVHIHNAGTLPAVITDHFATGGAPGDTPDTYADQSSSPSAFTRADNIYIHDNVRRKYSPAPILPDTTKKIGTSENYLHEYSDIIPCETSNERVATLRFRTQEDIIRTIEVTYTFGGDLYIKGCTDVYVTSYTEFSNPTTTTSSDS
jgi:hypothetical protein